MKVVYRSRKPVKRCRRGKSTNLNFSSNNNVLFSINTGAYTCISSLLVIDFFSLCLKLLLLLIVILVIFYSISHPILHDNTSSIPLMFLNTNKHISKDGLKSLINMIDPMNKRNNLNKRDVVRFIKKLNSKDKRILELSKENNALKKKISRDKTCNTSVNQILKLNNSVIHHNFEAIIINKNHETTINSDNTRIESLEIQQNIVNSKSNDEKELICQLTSILPVSSESSEKEAGRLINTLFEVKTSFRSFAKTITVMKKNNLYKGKYCPSSSSLIRWSIRAGISKLTHVHHYSEPCIDIMDHWIGASNQKIFAVLRLRLSTYQTVMSQSRALTLKDFDIIDLQVVQKSTGDDVCNHLIKLYSVHCQPLAIISDRGGDLNKGLRLYNEKNPNNIILHIEDVSHRIACFMKKAYGNESWFTNFFKTLGNINKSLNHGQYVYFKSPKQNAKGRFMNNYKQLAWFSNLYRQKQQGNLSKNESEQFDKLYKKVLKNINDIESVVRTTEYCHNIMKDLKINGLNSDTYTEIIQSLDSANINLIVKAELKAWLTRHFEEYQKLENKGWNLSLPITSDPIESMFAAFKLFQSRVPEGDPTRLIAIIPLLVGDNSPELIDNLIKQTTCKEAEEWVRENVPETIHAKKRKLYPTKKRTKSKDNLIKLERPYVQAIRKTGTED